MEYLCAFRKFLSRILFPGEAQIIAKLLHGFAKHYVNTTKTSKIFNSVDACFVITYLTFTNNTSFIAQERFIVDLTGVNDGADFDRQFLINLFEDIRNKPLRKKSKFGDSKKLGFLYKKKLFGWNKFYFMLNTENELFYFKNKDDELVDLVVGVFDVNNVNIETSKNGSKFQIYITSIEGNIKGGNYLEKENIMNVTFASSITIATSSIEDLEDWCDAILGNYKTLPTAITTKKSAYK